MSVFCFSTIFMKIKKLNHSFHDVDEKKGERRLAGGRANSEF
jgi:hypothetical protein